MASQPFPNPFSLAPQKLAQVINPLYWLTSGTGQIGFINISGTASASPEAEAAIIEDVATYGRQLGRISDVLEAVLAQTDRDDWLPAQKEAVSQFREMTAQIAAVKAGHMAPTSEHIDQLVAGINSLKDTNEGEYLRIKAELRQNLFADNKTEVETGLKKVRRAGGRKP
jgi:hypothetical protein